MKKILHPAIMLCSAWLLLPLTSCGSTPAPVLRTCEQDMVTLLKRFEEVLPLDELPKECFSTDGEVPRIQVASDKNVSSEAELLKNTKQIENQNFCRIVGMLDSKKGSYITGTFRGDVAALCWELHLGIAVYDCINKTTKYHDSTYWNGQYHDSTAENFYDFKAYFLVQIPRSDRDAWMLGLNVKEMDYDDRARLSRNTGVLVTNVYDGTPAFVGNMRPDYVITAVNDKPVATMEDWKRETANIQSGVAVKLTTARLGHDEYFTETVVPRDIPPEKPREEPAPQPTQIDAKTDMVLIEGGTFFMGDEGETTTKPVHEVTISSFYMSKHEVTQAEWKAIMNNNPSYCVGASFDERYQPVERVSWRDAIEYCNKRSDAEGLKRCYSKNENGGYKCNFEANGYRLPTEAEWEFVAHGGNRGKDKTYSGSSNINDVAWYNGNTGFPHPVMTRAPNKLGIYDLSGNVNEWCWDKYNNEYYEKSPKDNPRGATSSSVSYARSARGGSAYANENGCRVFTRYWGAEKDIYYSLGLRLVRTTMQ